MKSDTYVKEWPLEYQVNNNQNLHISVFWDLRVLQFSCKKFLIEKQRNYTQNLKKKKKRIHLARFLWIDASVTLICDALVKRAESLPYLSWVIQLNWTDACGWPAPCTMQDEYVQTIDLDSKEGTDTDRCSGKCTRWVTQESHQDNVGIQGKKTLY